MVNLRKLKGIEYLFQPQRYRLDINYREKSVKNTNTLSLNNMLLNNQEITEEIKEEITNYLETNDLENTMTQNLWDAAKAVLREIGRAHV